MYDNGVVIDAPAAGASMAMPLSYILYILFHKYTCHMHISAPLVLMLDGSLQSIHQNDRSTLPPPISNEQYVL